jgi:tetratricopeptide (TPR) repeat protein
VSGELTATGKEDLPTRTSARGSRRLPAGVQLGGRYRIAGLLGFGGMGMVYRAEDEELGLAVALKVLRPDMAPDPEDHLRWLARFKQELVLARQVSHPNVVRIHDIGSDGELVFLTMDFVPGRSLYQLLAEEGALAPERAREIARQIALGLGAAHRAGVVHRDLKPANVLVDDTGGTLRAAITDFGIARSLTGAHMTRPGAVLGTLGYLSPEQARGEAVDGRSDLYPLGLLLYEMLTGKLPFSEATEAEMLAERLTGGPRHLHWSGALGIAVPHRLRAIIHRLLAHDPDRRYPTAEAVVSELDRVDAGGGSWWTRSRAPRAVWAAAGGRLAGIAGIAGIAVLAVLFARGTPLRHPRLPARQATPVVGFQGSAAPPVPVAAGRHAVAFLPLADDTGRPDLAWVATGIPEMLTAALAESPELGVLDSQRVLRTLEDLKLPRGPLPEAEAARLATLLDADRLVGGRVHAAGDRLRVDLALAVTDPPGLPGIEIHAEAPANEAFRLVDEIGSALRQRLAVPPVPAAPGFAEPVASRSPAALASFARGSASRFRGDALAAVPALEAAVAADPRYTAAWVELAQARHTLGRDEPARQAAARAVATLRPGTSRAAYEARAVEARLLGRLDRAQEILSQLLARYPDDVEARVELAEAYGEQGSLDRAKAALADAVRLAPHHPRAWYLLGRYAIESGDARRAVDEYLVRALVVQNELGSDQGRADVWNAFGVGYRNLGAMERATESYSQAAALRQKIGDERGYAMTLHNLATLHLLRDEYKPAEAQLTEGLALFKRLGDREGTAKIENDFGALAEQRGNYEEALAYYRQALRDRRDLGDDLDLAESFSNVGFADYLLGRYDDALVYWRQGLDLARKSGDPSGIVLATQNLAQLELARGQWDEAVKSFLTALQSSRQLGMKEATAASLAHLGRLAQYQGRPVAALASYDEALKLFREVGDPRGLAEFTLGQAEVLLELGRTAAAAERLKASGEILRQGTNREQQAELARLRGEELLARGERAAAAEALHQAVAEATASHGVVELLASRLSLAAAGTPGAAGLASLERLSAEADALGNARLRLRAAELLARAALAAGDPRRAERAARAGLEQAAACGGAAGAYRLHLLLARALERGGPGGVPARRAEARAERRRAAEEIARVSRELSPAEQESFARRVEAEEGEEKGKELGRHG